MEVGSPKNGYEDIHDFWKDDDSTFPEELDLDFKVSQDIVDSYVHDDLDGDDKYHLDLSDQGQQELPSQYCDISGSPQNFNSPVQSGRPDNVLGDTEVVNEPEKLEIQSNENDHHDDYTEVDSESILQIQNRISVCPWELVSIQDASLQDALDRPMSPPHHEIGQEMYIEAVKNELAQSEHVYNKDVDEKVTIHHKEKCFVS
ncbi:serine/arginine repetitive matrix protein 2-like [Forsythia ovata]|uniref:Serine/arginine repetitive matrix protein 2-like n=1 Tax=Forsythia ovata TaxID=205694 RepID=A0ABD1Q9S9_9LAMI